MEKKVEKAVKAEKEEKVILVDENDKETGAAGKLEAHRKAFLHRAFSLFVFNSRGDLLLQRRAQAKYHSAGLWANACCSHPRPGKRLEDEAHRKLKQELGFDCALEERFSFVYKAELDNGLSEHEYDHVFAGTFDGRPKPNPEEVEEYAWVSLASIRKDVKMNPEKYASWFRILINDHAESFAEYVSGRNLRKNDKNNRDVEIKNLRSKLRGMYPSRTFWFLSVLRNPLGDFRHIINNQYFLKSGRESTNHSFFSCFPMETNLVFSFFAISEDT